MHQSEDLHHELHLLVQGNHSCLKVPQKLQRHNVAELIQQATQSHSQTCGKRMCQHLLRFLQRVRGMVEGVYGHTNRRPLGVKLQNIKEIQVEQQTRQVDAGWEGARTRRWQQMSYYI